MENEVVVHQLVGSKALQIWHIQYGLWLKKGLTFDERRLSGFASSPCVLLE